MGWLGRAASSAVRGSVRATGRTLARHVVPDSVIPSWKTQRAVSSAGRLLASPFKRKKKPKPGPAKKSGNYRSPALAGVRPASRPAGTAPPSARVRSAWSALLGAKSDNFNKQAWAVGRRMPAPSEFQYSPPVQPAPRVPLREKVRAIREEPRLFAQMYVDEAAYTVRRSAQNLRDTVKRNARHNLRDIGDNVRNARDAAKRNARHNLSDVRALWDRRWKKRAENPY